MEVRKEELKNWAPYGLAKPIPANLRNYLGMLDIRRWPRPPVHGTDEAIANLAKQYESDPKALKKKLKELESEAWEDFLDMTISQAILWAAQNIAALKRDTPRSPPASLTSSAPIPALRAPGSAARPTWPTRFRPITSGTTRARSTAT
jgi:hypothetical protein